MSTEPKKPNGRDPYDGFKSDKERRLALKTKEFYLTLRVVLPAALGSCSCGLWWFLSHFFGK